MPSINRPTISRAVESVLNQTDDRWHLCIVYDNIADPIVAESKKITCINLDKKLGVGNNSAGNVRNVAIEKFADQYKWIGFIDDDDHLDKNYVKLLYSKYSHYDLVIFRMKRTSDVLPPGNSQQIISASVGISFCYKTEYKTLFTPDPYEDFNLLTKLKGKGCIHIVSDEIGYYVRNAHE